LTAATHGLEKEELHAELEKRNLKIPVVDENAQLLVPPKPVGGQMIENWPLATDGSCVTGIEDIGTIKSETATDLEDVEELCEEMEMFSLKNSNEEIPGAWSSAEEEEC
jgi:hypothetical protein